MKRCFPVALVTMLCAGATTYTLLGPTLWPPIVETPPVPTTPTERAFDLLKCYGISSPSFGDPSSVLFGVFPTPEEAVRGLLESPNYFFTTGPFEPANVLPLDSSYGPNAYQALNENDLVIAVVWVESVPGEPERFTAGESVSCTHPTISEPYIEPAGYSTTATGVPWWGVAIWGLLMVGASAAWIGLLRRGAVTSPARGDPGSASPKAEPAPERVWAAHRHLRAQVVILFTMAVIFGLCWALWQYSAEVLIGSDGKAPGPAGWITRGPLVGHVMVEDHNVNVVTLMPLLVPLITSLWVLNGRRAGLSRKGRAYAQRLNDVTSRWAIPAVSMALVACVLDYALGGSGFQQWALPYPYATRLVDSWWLIEVAGVSAWWFAVGSGIRHIAAEARAGTPPTTRSEAVARWNRAIRAQTLVVVGALAAIGVLHIGQGGGGWITDELPGLPMYLLFLSVLLTPALHWWSVRRIAQSADHEPRRRRSSQLEATVRVFALPATIAGFLATAATLALIPLTDSPWQYVEDFDADLTFTAIMVVVVVIEILTALAWRRRAMTHRTTVELDGPPSHGDHADEAFATSPR